MLLLLVENVRCVRAGTQLLYDFYSICLLEHTHTHTQCAVLVMLCSVNMNGDTVTNTLLYAVSSGHSS